jgi:hypothetical protein
MKLISLLSSLFKISEHFIPDRDLLNLNLTNCDLGADLTDYERVSKYMSCISLKHVHLKKKKNNNKVK